MSVTPAFDDALLRVVEILRLEREFRSLPDPTNHEARNQHIELAIKTLEELLAKGQTRFEKNLLEQVGKILQKPELIETVANAVDRRWKYSRGTKPIAPVGYDLIEGGIAIGVLDDVCARVQRVLEEFSPSF